MFSINYAALQMTPRNTDATRRFAVRSTPSALLQTNKASFGPINPAKGFRLPQAESSHTEVAPRGTHLIQYLVECLRHVVPFSRFWMGCAHGTAGLR
jgi:hypothetical protein